ncbi:MAG: polysaccharide deacetylase family protein [Oscillospiraceae bacterium]|jgi:peptidoglycan/xylan/chitin deacetylase (PgdA/CDA1 family)|nr:polysaccharide deacetylase family protein [Oscillospiraceae bacterium]
MIKTGRTRFFVGVCGFLLIAALVLALGGCGGTPGESGPGASPPAGDGAVAPEQTPTPTPTPTTVPSLTPTPEPAQESAPLVEYDGVVEHLFFHTAIAYPELAFDGDSQEAGFDEWMVTVDEYVKILQNLYEKDYILVNMNDVWSEYTDESGAQRMKRNTLMLPEGKKPLILSYDDISYYEYMLPHGFPYKLIIGYDGEIYSYGLDPEGNEVFSQELDAVPILDKFVEEHPDFSLGGVKGCIALTGYNGILGYRTQTDKDDASPEFEARRQQEIVFAKPVVEKLKETGWYFASHTWGHVRLDSMSPNGVKADAQRWLDEVGALIGPTKLLIYPHGSRLDGDDVTKTGESFRYYHGLGFRVFASVGIESFSKIKTDISAVICDRMHADGATLRRSRERYLKFYDAADVFDSSRPDLGKDW